MRRTALFTVMLLAAAAALAGAAAPASAVGWVHTGTWGTYGSLPGQLAEGTDMTVFNNQLYVCDYSNDRVQVFTTDGGFLRQWAVADPLGIAVDRQSHKVYVGGPVVTVWTLAGTSLGQLTSSGSDPGQTNYAGGIAVDAVGNVYVADIGNDRVLVFDSAGAYIRQIGSAGTTDGHFDYPSDLDLDSNGNVYVFDFGRQRVSTFAPDGTFLSAWGSPGTAEGFFNGAMRLTIDSNDHVFVGDRYNDRIQELTTAGVCVRRFSAPGCDTPLGLTSDLDGTVFASRNGAGAKLFRWDWDDTAPVLGHDYDGEWHSQTFNVHFWAQDDYTAVPWLRWSPNGVDWTNGDFYTVSAAENHSYDGYNAMTVGAGDSVSNWAYKTVRVKIDTRAPISKVSGVPSGWTNQEVWAYIDATDVGSGVHRTFYDLNGGGLTELPDTGRVIIDTAGVNTLQFFSQDNCADVPNQEVPKLVQVPIDFVGPTARPTSNIVVRRNTVATFRYTLNDDWSPTCTVKLVIKKRGVTVKTVSLGVKDSTLQVPPHSYSKKLTIGLAAGTYSWTVVARDLAGNLGSWAPKTLTVRL